MNTVIDIVDLTKSFGRTRALDGLDLSVAEGEVHGFVGPNGAGKSTTLRILLGLLRADGGKATMLGQDPWRDVADLHRRIAYVPGDVNLWPNLTGGEVIDMLGRMRGGISPQRRAEMLERFDLDPTKKARTYSKGNRQKVALVAALASDAELLLLDEPTSGLDPLMERLFRDEVVSVAAQGRTVLLSSHILSEVEALADRISIIRAGRVVETGPLAEMRHLHNTRVRAELARPVQPGALHAVEDLVVDGAQVSFSVDDVHLDEVVAALSSHGIRSLTSEPVSLEELFLSAYGTDAATGLHAPQGTQDPRGTHAAHTPTGAPDDAEPKRALR
ncbi:ABC transporter ATP-binding protein [Raineyella antarctica]|uniref:ABC transporter ATP-binding protein n=1 Tax=Raineyella antarctica TaxID=1577474 RepID=UPI000B805A77|nr:ABC transporter ATP-binding protein [Raineyella antarctica]